MNRSIRKAVAFSGVLAMMAILMIPNAAAENKPSYESQTVLENQYDTAVTWNDGAVFIKNGSTDSITDQTEMKLVKSDGTVSDFANTQKFDKIYTSISGSYYNYLTNPYYTDASYLIVGKDGKKALLKDDGSFIGNALYEDIYSATDNFMAVQKGDKTVVQKPDSTVVKEYNKPVNLAETENSLIVISNQRVIGLFDKNLNEIDLSAYDTIFYSRSIYGNSDSYLVTRVNDKQGILSDTGKEIVPAEYTGVSSFSYKGVSYYNAYNMIGSITDNSYEPNGFTIYKADGTVLFDNPTGLIETSDLDNTGGYADFLKDNLHGIYDFNSGTVKVNPIYERIMACDNHCFAYELDGKQGIKTYDNKDIIKPDKYPGDWRVDIGGNLIIVNIPDNSEINESTKYTTYIYAIDTGKLITKFDKYDIVELYNGIIVAANYTGNKDPNLTYSIGILDDNGNEIISPGTYDSIYPIDLISAWLVMKDGKIGIVDKNGLSITDIVYQSLGRSSVSNFSSSNLLLFNSANHKTNKLFVCTKQNDKWGLLEITPIVYATGLSLDKTDASLTVGNTMTLKPTISPTDATNPKIDWSSSDESVATVKDGIVTALKAGTATITAKAEDGGFTATCTITVTEKTASTTTKTTTNGNNTTGTDTQPSVTDTTAITTTATDTTATTPKSPSTGESSLFGGVLTFIAISALTVGFTRKKKV